MKMKKSTEYAIDGVRCILSSLREQKELDQEAVKQVMEILKHNLQTSQVRLKYVKEEEEAEEKFRPAFVGVKLN